MLTFWENERCYTWDNAYKKKKCVLKVNTTLKILTHGAYETMRGWSLGSI